MPKILTLADLPDILALNLERSSRVKEGTDVCVKCSHSHRGGTQLRSNMCELDVNKTSRNTAGFPLKVTVRVERRSSKVISSYYIVDHKAVYTFWIPYDSIIFDKHFDVISKIIFLMNVPFSLEDHKLKWKDVETLENQEAFVSKILEFARSMRDRASLISNEDGYMNLDIRKTTRLLETEFIEIYNNMDEKYNYESWKNNQRELESRIANFEALQKEVEIKKMRFEANAFESSYLSDMCLICREEFLTGSTVCCINHCSQVYHEVCILEWLLTNRSCPYCRSELGKKFSSLRLST